MPEQELNLLQLSAGGAAEASATSAEIMRREFAHANLGGEFLDDVPHQLFGNSFAPDSARAAHSPEEAARANSGSRRPGSQ